MPTIGILDSASPHSRGEEMDAFYKALAKGGRKGSDTWVLNAWAGNDYTQLETLADVLLANNVSVIVALGGPVSAIVAKSKTSISKTPVIFATITDPKASGLVENFQAPEGNVTGTFGHTTDLDDERLAALNVIAPPPGPLGILCNPKRPFPKDPDPNGQVLKYKEMATKLDRESIVVNATTAAEIAAASKQFKKIKGLLVSADALFNSHRHAVIKLANSLKVPAMYQWRAYVADGGLMSYGPKKTDGYENAGDFVVKILKDTPVKELPVRVTKQSRRDFFVNSITAASLGMKLKSPAFKKAEKILGVTITLIR